MRTEHGSFTYEVPTDAAGLASIGVWLRARVLPVLVVTELIAVGYVVMGVLGRSWLIALVGLALGTLLPAGLMFVVAKQRSGFARRMGPRWRAWFGPEGARVDLALSSTSYAWGYFNAWTVREGTVILVHAGPPMSFVAVPIALVPEDEWQQLTTLFFAKLGPARKPDSVRGGRLNRSTSRKLGEAATIHP